MHLFTVTTRLSANQSGTSAQWQLLLQTIFV